MTKKQTFLPGDIVERTGETAFGLIKGGHYTVRATFTEGGTLWLMFSSAISRGAQLNARGFKLIERPGG